MTCPKCQHVEPKKFGTYGPEKIQRYRCRTCSATFSQPQPKPLGRHYTSVEDAARAVSLLCEGMSIRAVSRIMGLHKNTLLRLLLTVGQKGRAISDTRCRGIIAKRVQVDEIWCFVGAKQKNATPEQKAGGWGDCWTWTALDADSKLIISYCVGPRSPRLAFALMGDLASRLASRVQLTTDGLYWYPHAVERAFGIDVDYAMQTKHYADAQAGRYSPPRMVSSTTEVIRGNPMKKYISTSYVERQNLTMRMSMRRFTRLTNAFSKSVEHHAAMVDVYFAFYNFCRVHQTLRVTPAMQAGLTDHVWSVEELITAA